MLSHPSDFAFYSINQSINQSLINESVAFAVTENFSKVLLALKDFLQIFHRRSCTIVVNTIAKLKPVLKNRRKHYLFSALLLKRTLSKIIVFSLNFRILFF